MRKDSRWIDASKKLPRPNQRVLVSDGQNIYIGGGWTGMGTKVTGLYGSNDIGQTAIHKLTHWMPLPKPPK